MNYTNLPIAIITGGGAGIGLSITKKFIQENIFPVVIGRSEEKLSLLKKEFGEKCDTLSFDLTLLQGIPQLIESIHKKYGRIDILINNAGINQKKSFEEVTDEEFQRIIHTNVNAVFSMSREVVKVMEQQKKGSIINISSMAAQYGIPKVIAYTASKSAIEGMTAAMAVELSPKGIRVNAVAPGFIVTDMSSKALDSDPERKSKVMGRTPLGYLGSPTDVANAVHFLATESAHYITGVVLRVDGGNAIGF